MRMMGEAGASASAWRKCSMAALRAGAVREACREGAEPAHDLGVIETEGDVRLRMMRLERQSALEMLAHAGWRGRRRAP